MEKNKNVLEVRKDEKLQMFIAEGMGIKMRTIAEWLREKPEKFSLLSVKLLITTFKSKKS